MDMSYDKPPFPIREDLVAAQRKQWVRLGRPGSWLTGEQRLAIAGEVRKAATCELCRRRKESLSPYTVEGEHEGNELLPWALVDVVHRVTTDPGRLTREWFDRVIAGGITCEQYVETIGVLVTVFSIDSFCRGVGVPLHPLPDPVSGEPSRYRPTAARMENAWVPMLPNGRIKGPDADLWGEMPLGRGVNVVRALSLVPDEVRAFKELNAAHYMSPADMMNPEHTRRSIGRRQIEFIAARVSVLRGCFY